MCQLKIIWKTNYNSVALITATEKYQDKRIEHNCTDNANTYEASFANPKYKEIRICCLLLHHATAISSL